MRFNLKRGGRDDRKQGAKWDDYNITRKREKERKKEETQIKKFFDNVATETKGIIPSSSPKRKVAEIGRLRLKTEFYVVADTGEATWVRSNDRV